MTEQWHILSGSVSHSQEKNCFDPSFLLQKHTSANHGFEYYRDCRVELLMPQLAESIHSNYAKFRNNRS